MKQDEPAYPVNIGTRGAKAVMLDSTALANPIEQTRLAVSIHGGFSSQNYCSVFPLTASKNHCVIFSLKIIRRIRRVTTHRFYNSNLGIFQMTDLDVEAFLAEREAQRKRLLEEEELIERLKADTPHVQPMWDKSPGSVQFNDINEDFLAEGIVLYSAGMTDVWNGLFRPSIYDANTLWSELHCNRKIARVIRCWQSSRSLSPMFLVKHGAENLGLVADGKHRLTVARYMTCNELPFMVPKSQVAWVKSAMPNAVVELEIYQHVADDV